MARALVAAVVVLAVAVVVGVFVARGALATLTDALARMP